MPRSFAARRPAVAVVLASLGVWLAPSPAIAQISKSQAAPAAEARAPGAIEAMPPWLKDAPFDAAQFFAMPLKAENAAPLYIEALAEVGADVADWLPPGRRALVEAGKARWALHEPTIQAYQDDRASVPPAQADAALAAFADALRKLDAAQARPRCVIATGLGVDTLLPHIQAARSKLARLLVVQVGRSLDRDDFPAALKGVERTLRLSRDIRARGFPITETVAISIDAVALDQMVPYLLASRKLKPDHCDRLLKLLNDHEAQALDPLRVGVMGDYATSRVILRTFGDGRETVAGPDGRPIDQAIDDPTLIRQVAALARSFALGDLAEVADDPKRMGEALDEFRRAIPKLRARIDAQARAVLDAPATYSARTSALKKAQQAHPTPAAGPLASLFNSADPLPLTTLAGRNAVQIDATRCLVALRRWQMTSTKPPTDLAAVCKAAKLAAVPADPFGDGPLKMATVGDEPVVYSIGPDGRDDHAQVDSEKGKKPEGDLIYRLPKRK